MALNAYLSATPEMLALQVWAIMPSSGLRFFHRLREVLGLWKVACLEGGGHRGHVLGLTLFLWLLAFPVLVHCSLPATLMSH